MYLCLKKENGSTPDVSWATVSVLPGDSMTLNFGESPSVARESTLLQILEANVPEKYYLSAKACAGILRRAEKRGKELPKMLKDALEEVVRLDVWEHSWGGQGSSARGIGWSDSVAPTIKSVMSGSNQVPDVVYTLEGNTVDRTSSKNGRGWSEGVTPTLNTQDRHAVAIDCRNFKENFEVSGTLQAKSNGGYSLNYQNPIVYSSSSHGSLSEGVGTIGTGTRAVHEMVAVYDTTQITSPSNYSKPKPGDACHPLAAQQHPPLAVYPERTGALCANSHPGSYTGQDAFNDMLPVILSEKPPRKYIVRRLTPLECCRLQGFPDWWMDDVEGSDSAKYKMWGNGIALPCAVDVISRLEEV